MKSSPQSSQRTRAKPGGKDAACEVFAKRLLHIRGRGVVVALPVELTGAGELQPGLKVFGNCAVQQGALGVAGVVDFGGLGGCRCLSRLRASRGMLVPTRVLADILR